MAIFKKQTKKKDMQTHIKKSYEIIDEYLPATYLSRVREKLPKHLVVSDGHIKNIKSKFSKPDNQLDVLNALVEVALENKAAIERLEKINH
jgi:hypothetical protein